MGNNHGTVVGAGLVTNRLGQPASAYQFDGTTSRIEFAASPLNQTTDWTLAAWVQPATFVQQGVAVHVGFDNFSTGDGFGYGLFGNAVWQALFSNVGFFNSGLSFPGTNQWAHLVMTRTNGTLIFYMNGVKGATYATGNPFQPTDFTIGSQNGARFFNGAVDEVRIFNRALASN